MPCFFPYGVQNKRPTSQEDTWFNVPCGRCPECLKRRATQWAFRIKKQSEMSEKTYFVTLTYSNENIPRTKAGYKTLSVQHCQKFFKRLRKSYAYKAVNPDTGKIKTYYDKVPEIKYYLAAEYGSQTFRPHYHIIITNADESNIIKSWCLGHVHIGTVSGASIAYTTKYINKGKLIPQHAKDDRVPEFSLMSKRLGSNYLSEETVSWHRSRLDKPFIYLEDGVKMSIPRYYREKIWNEEERRIQGRIIQQRIKEDAEYNLEQPTEAEQFESKRASLEFIRKHYQNRKDL